MIDLRRFFINPFNDEAISIDEIVNYAAEHLVRMIANNPGGVLNTFITSTTTALAVLDGTLTDETSKLGIQKARTQAKVTFRDTLDEAVAKIHGDFVASFGRDSTEVTEAFPEGRSIFDTCDDSLLENKLGALNTAVTTYSGALKPTTVGLSGSLLSIWIALYAAAGTGRGNKAASSDARRAAVKGLKKQCFKNLLGLAMQSADETETVAVQKADIYCPQHLLEDPQGSGPSPTPPPTP